MKFSRPLQVLNLLCCVTVIGALSKPFTADGEGRKTETATAAPAAAHRSLAKDELDSTLVYSARDSLIYHFDNRTMDLFGRAKVDYKDMHIRGPRISMDYNSSLLHTEAASDSLGKPVERPVYTDSKGSFTAREMTYNYKTRKGRTSDVSSQDQLGRFSGALVKRLPDGELYIRDGIYTTCDLEEPHFWIAGKNMKIIPDDRLVARPFIMYIHPEIFSLRLPKIPILPLPFMSLPITDKRSSGFLLPRLGGDSNRGTYIADMGYFWAISDYTDLRLAGDFAFNGSWRLSDRFRYSKRYEFNGTVEGEYESYQLNSPDSPAHAEYNNWFVKVRHHQEFDPDTKLDLNLQYIGGDRYYDVNSIDPERIITEQATSYASFSRSFDEGNRVLTAGYQGIDDLRYSNLTRSLTASLYQNKLYPFRPERPGSATDWSSRLFVTPAASFAGQFSRLNAVNTDLYTGNASLEAGFLQDFAPGYRATVTQGVTLQGVYKRQDQQPDLSGTRVQYPLKIQSTLFRYLNLNPSVTFSQYHVNSMVRKYFDGTNVVTAIVDEPADYSTAIFSVDAQTRMYGTVNTGLLEHAIGMKALRHVFIPSLSFTANPDYTGQGYDIYGTYRDASGNLVRYNRLESSLYSSVPVAQQSVGISLQNLLYGKFRNGSVSTGSENGAAGGDRVVQLLALTAASSYNFAADSLRIAPLAMTASSNALSPNFLMTAGASYDFYTYNPATGARINKLNTESGNGLLRFLGGYLNMSMSVSGTLREPYDESSQDGSVQQPAGSGSPMVEGALYRERFTKGEQAESNSLLPWSLRASLYLASDRINPLQPASTALLNSSARFCLTRNWQFGLNTGYDLQSSAFIIPSILVVRDLHDFLLSFQLVPSGQFRSYFVQLGMKAPQLQDIKVRSGRTLN